MEPDLGGARGTSPSPAEAAVGPEPTLASSVAAPRLLYWSWTGASLGLLLAAVSAGITWILLQLYYPVFHIPQELIDLGPNATAEQETLRNAAIATANRNNAMVGLALLGSLLGAAVGLASGLARRHAGKALVALLACGILGGVAGVLGGLFSDVVYLLVKPPSRSVSVFQTILIQAAGLAIVGLGIALGLRVALGGTPLAAGVKWGLASGLVAGCAYPILAAVAYPLGQVEWTVPFGPREQQIWVAVTACVLGILLPAKTTSAPN